MDNSVLIGMSGGVDSSVAVYLLKASGLDCFGATLKLYSKSNPFYKSALPYSNNEDISLAEQLSKEMDVPFVLLDNVSEFKEKVIDSFIFVYENGGTPNPCLFCNKAIKFPILLREADKKGIKYIATGHYARIEQNLNTGRYILKKAKDKSKDQSYVLYSLDQDTLSRLLLPLGDYSKQEIREIAAEHGFENADKSDSQDICFVPDGDYYNFILNYTGKNYPKGMFVDLDGAVLGEHKGLIAYTIGQRRGLGLALKHPMYVCDKNIVDNTVVLCENSRLFNDTLYANNFNWLSVEKPTEPIRACAKIRYNQKEQPATIYPLENDMVKVVFDEPQRAIAKGQAVVLYDADVLLGGGIIL